MTSSSTRLSPLVWLIALSVAGYVVLALWFPLWPAFNHVPLSDVRSFSPSLGLGLLYGALLCGLFWLSARAFRVLRDRPLRLRGLLLVTILLGLPLLFTYPINANDLYRYVIRGRIQTVYGGNPYAQPPSAFPGDPLLPLAGEWAGETSPYGPLWELTAAAVTGISGGGLLAGLLLFKLLGLAAHSLTAVVIWLILAEKPAGARAAFTALWAWNPALLLIFVTDAHNDAPLLLLLVLGMLLLQRDRAAGGVTAVLAGTFVKPIGALLLPLTFLAGLRRQATWRARGRFVLLVAIAGLVGTAVVFAVYGSPLNLAMRLLREASAGAGFSPLALLLLLLQRFGVSVSFARIGQAALALFGLFLVWSWVRVWQGDGRVQALLPLAGDTFFAYLLQALNFRIWYTAWTYPFWLLAGALSGSGYRLRAGWWFLLTGQLSVIIYGHLYAYWRPDILLIHLIGVPFTFGLPFVLALWVGPRE